MLVAHQTSPSTLDLPFSLTPVNAKEIHNCNTIPVWLFIVPTVSTAQMTEGTWGLIFSANSSPSGKALMDAGYRKLSCAYSGNCSEGCGLFPSVQWYLSRHLTPVRWKKKIIQNVPTQAEPLSPALLKEGEKPPIFKGGFKARCKTIFVGGIVITRKLKNAIGSRYFRVILFCVEKTTAHLSLKM